MLLVTYDDSGRVIGIYRHGRVQDGAIYVNGQKVAEGIHCHWAYVPDQSVAHLYVLSPDGSLELRAKYPDDFVLFTIEEKQELIDHETEEVINKEIHAFAPIGEQIGILRDQLVCVLNALGIEPTPEFARLNEIAIKEIEAARKKKEATDAQDDPA